jgi:hypothetical protein
LAHGVIGSGGGKIEGGGPIQAKNGPKLDNPLFYQNGPTLADLTHITTNAMLFSLFQDRKYPA